MVSNSLGKSNVVLVLRGFVEDRKADFGTPEKVDGGWEGRQPP